MLQYQVSFRVISNPTAHSQIAAAAPWTCLADLNWVSAMRRQLSGRQLVVLRSAALAHTAALPPKAAGAANGGDSNMRVSSNDTATSFVHHYSDCAAGLRPDGFPGVSCRVSCEGASHPASGRIMEALRSPSICARAVFPCDSLPEIIPANGNGWTAVCIHRVVCGIPRGNWCCDKITAFYRTGAQPRWRGGAAAQTPFEAAAVLFLAQPRRAAALPPALDGSSGASGSNATITAYATAAHEAVASGKLSCGLAAQIANLSGLRPAAAAAADGT